jgi:hypothetical protein
MHDADSSLITIIIAFDNQPTDKQTTTANEIIRGDDPCHNCQCQ